MEEKKLEETTVQAGSDAPPSYGQSTPTKASISQRILDSFKRDPNHTITGQGQEGADGSGFDLETAAHNTAHSPLQRRLKGRHLQMIAIGGSIGTDSRPSLTLYLTNTLQARVFLSVLERSYLMVVRLRF